MSNEDRYTVRLMDQETVKLIRIMAATYGMVHAELIGVAVKYLRAQLANDSIRMATLRQGPRSQGGVL